MEFEDYEDMFTFEEWSFQHPPSDGNDAKTFDELCEEVLMLSYACDKERSNEHDSQSNVRQVSSKSHEGTEVKRVYAVESVIPNDTSLTSHLELGVDCHSQQDFAAGGSQTTNDFILLAETHESISQSSSDKDIVSTELVSEDDREAQCLECKRVSKNSENSVPIQLAMNSTTSEAEECVLDSNHSSYNSFSEDENTLQNSTDTLKVTPKQTPSKSTIVAREETKVSISVFEDTQPGNCRSDKDISVSGERRSEEQEIPSEITASFIQNTHIENESFKDSVNDSGESVDENEKKSQNTMLEFQIKVDVNTEINSVSESEENQYDITIGLADSQDTQLKYTSVTGNVTSDLVSVKATSLSTMNSFQLPEVAKVDNVTDAARNQLSEESERQSSSSETAFHNSPSSEVVFLYSLSPNQKKNEEITNNFDTKSNADASPNVITCGSKSEEALSLEDSTLNYQEADKEQYPNSDINIDTNANFKKEKYFDSISQLNDTDIHTEFSFWQRNYLENKLEKNDLSVKVSKMKRKSENCVTQETGSVKTKLVLRRTRNETSDVVHGQICNISKESSRNHLETRKRRFKSRLPVSREIIKTYSNKKRSGTLRESTCEMKSPFISSDKQNTSGNKSTTNDSEKKNITLSKPDCMGIQQAMNADNLKSSKLASQEPDSKLESVFEITTPPETMTGDSNKFKPKFSLSTEKESRTKSAKTEFVLPKSMRKERETVTNAEQDGEKNNITSNKEVIYLRTTETISLMDDTVTSSTPSTDEKKCREETSAATIEINTNKQFSKGRLRTVINVKHNCVSPECASTCVIHQSDSSGEKMIMSARRWGAARIVPFSRNTGSAFTLGPFRSTLDEKCTVGAVHRTKIRFLKKESDLHSYQRNFPDDIDDEIIVSESDDQSGLALQPKTYERKLIRYDYISPKVDNRDSRSRKRAADPLTSDVKQTPLQDSLEKKSESTINKNTTVPNEEPMSPRPKKPRLESTEKSFTEDANSKNESFIHSNLDIKKTDSLEIDSQKETQNSGNLENVSNKRLENPSMSSILITQDENPEEGTTQIFHRDEIQCNHTFSKVHQADNCEGNTTSNMSESFCDSSSNNIFNDETVKAICASEKAEISIPSPAKAIESGKSIIAESTKNSRHPLRSSRVGMMRRSCDCGSEFSFSTRKSRMDILKSQAKFLKNISPKNTSHNGKTEGEKKTCIQTASVSSHPRSDSEVEQYPFTEDSKTREREQPASEPPQTSSSTESGTRACSVQFGNATNKQVASATRTVRRLRRTTVPLQFPVLPSSQGVASSAAASGRILRRRVLPSAQPAAPTPPIA